MFRLGKIYKCRYCSKSFVVLPTSTKSILPVEFVNNRVIGKEFDSSIHTSHLTNCPQLQSKWEEAKKLYRKQFYNKNYKGKLLMDTVKADPNTARLANAINLAVIDMENKANIKCPKGSDKNSYTKACWLLSRYKSSKVKSDSVKKMIEFLNNSLNSLREYCNE